MVTLASAKQSAKQMVAVARQWVVEAYADEKIVDVGLEELRLEDDVWEITIGFKRKRSHPRRSPFVGLSGPLAEALDNKGFEPALKVVSISDKSGEVIAMRDRLAD